MRVRKLRDGTPLNSNFKVSKMSETHTAHYRNNGIYKGIVIKKTNKKDKNNKWKKTNTYDIMLVGGARDGEVITSATPLCGFGGKDNYLETTYKPTSKKLDKNLRPEDTDGSFVAVQFMDGHYGKPVIMGGWPTSDKFGIDDSEEIAVKGHFNGLDISISKDGTLNLKYGSTEIDMNGKDGDLNIKTSKDAKITSTGKTQINSTGNVEVNSSGNVNLSGSSGIGFTGPTITIGSSGATEHVILGDAFKSFFDAHVHSGAGTPPTIPMPGSLLSTKAKVD